MGVLRSRRGNFDVAIATYRAFPTLLFTVSVLPPLTESRVATARLFCGLRSVYAPLVTDSDTRICREHGFPATGNRACAVGGGVGVMRGQHWKSIPCEWNGIRYNSIKEAAEANYVTPSGMWHRLSKGYQSDNDLYSKSGKSLVWNEIYYPSRSAAAKALKISAMAVTDRLRRGYTTDSDLITKGNPRKPKPRQGRVVVWNEIEYISMVEAAHAVGITPTAMQYRIKQGYTRDSDMSWQRTS